MRSISNQSDTFDKGKTSQDLFKELVGDDQLFFNKDANTENPFNSREISLDHSDECDCLDCESDRVDAK